MLKAVPSKQTAMDKYQCTGRKASCRMMRIMISLTVLSLTFTQARLQIRSTGSVTTVVSCVEPHWMVFKVDRFMLVSRARSEGLIRWENLKYLMNKLI